MVKKKNKLDDLINVVKRLRNPKNGCPWDIQQTSKSLAKYTLEEAYEVIEAIESNNNKELEGELGDLLLQVIYHSVIAAEKKKFSIEDVIDTSVKKMKSRHPHIFMRDESIKTVQDVNDFWETQKKFERKKKGAKSVLDGVSVNLPAVTRSLKLQKRAAKEGFDWKNANGTLKKVKEELNELSNQGAHLFRSLGLKPGDSIAIMLENHFLFFPIIFAAWRSGLRYTTISWRLQPSEVEYIVKDCEAKILITSKFLEETAKDLNKVLDLSLIHI